MTFDTTKQIVTLTTACLGWSTSERVCVGAAGGSGTGPEGARWSE